MEVRDRRQLALMLAPYAFGVVVFVALPTTVTIALAFTEYDLVRAPELVGLQNFRELVHDDVFRTALVNSLVFAAIATPLRLLVALGLALLLHRPAPGTGAARVAVILPTVAPEVAYGLLWLWLFNPVYGPLGALLTAGGANGETILGRLPPQWLTDPNHARAGVILMSLFTIGEGFVILLVARATIPSDLFELASLEDATWWDVFRRITLPLMAPALALLFLRDLVLGLQTTFVPSLLVWDGGPPDHATTYLGLFVYRNAFEYLRYGYAAAATVVMLVLTLAAVGVQLWALRRWRHRAIGSRA